MAPDDLQSGERRARAKASVKAWAAELDAARRRAGLTLPERLSAPAEHLRRLVSQWLLADVAPGRLAPWLPVGFGFGIVLYFSADREPAWWAAGLLTLAGIAIAFAARRSVIGFPLTLGFAVIALGFATATLQTARLAHPVLAFPTWSAQVQGFVETREERARSDRFVVRVQVISAPRMAVKPQRVRVAVRKGTAPDVCNFVAFKAHLSPPLQPLRPGGYDFARGMYFQEIGASGYVLGKIRTEPAAHAPDLRLRAAGLIDRLRENINRRIHALLPADRGSIASALITGKRNAISKPVNDALYVSSLAHVLAISGSHMAVGRHRLLFPARWAGTDRRPSIRVALARRRRHRRRRTRSAVRWARIGRYGARVAHRRPRHHALRSFSRSSAGALRRARQSRR